MNPQRAEGLFTLNDIGVPKRHPVLNGELMKNKRIIIIGIIIIAICLLLIIGMALAPNISAYLLRGRMADKLNRIEAPEYVIINDNRSENIGGEYIEYDTQKCRALIGIVAKALEEASFEGTRDNFLGGFALIFRVSDSKDDIKLWFYEDKIEIENGTDIAIYKTKNSKAFEALLELTK